MATVTASGLTKNIGARTLFSGVSFKLTPGERMALSGRNGSGKTTLLRILAGESGLDAGSVSMRSGVRVVLHDQRPPRSDSTTLREYVLTGLGWILEIEEELAELERRMSAGESGDDVLGAYARAQGRLDHAGGYRWRDAATAAVRGLGFGDAELDRPLEGFSGGELTRASLARALAAKPELLLLDEPTNHLDIDSMEWLERYLIGLDAAVILVAHDRWFLESVGTSVLELESGRARFFAGPWHAWREEKAAREIAAGRDADKRRRDIARMERFVERFRYKATTAIATRPTSTGLRRRTRGCVAGLLTPATGRTMPTRRRPRRTGLLLLSVAAPTLTVRRSRRRSGDCVRDWPRLRRQRRPTGAPGGRDAASTRCAPGS